MCVLLVIGFEGFLNWFLGGLLCGTIIGVFTGAFFKSRSCPYAGIINKKIKVSIDGYNLTPTTVGDSLLAEDSIHPTDPPPPRT